MRIFALETDLDTLTRNLVADETRVIRRVHHHGLVFILKLCKSVIISAIVATLSFAAVWVGLPVTPIVGVAAIMVFFFAVFPLLTAFIDWNYDILILTPEKIVIVDQSSIFRRHIRQMSLENVASANAETQFWNILPFGRLCFDLKEGVGERLCLAYIPHADDVATCIGDALAKFERGDQG